MSIAERIKELEAIQEKIDTYGKVKQSLLEVFDKDYEVTKAVCSFCDSQVAALNNVGTVKASPTTAKAQTEKAADIAVKDLEAEIPTDPLRFAMKYKKMEGKEVTIKTGGGDFIKAYVRGVAPPNVVVETDTGYTVQVPPQDIEV